MTKNLISNPSSNSEKILQRNQSDNSTFFANIDLNLSPAESDVESDVDINRARIEKRYSGVALN